MEELDKLKRDWQRNDSLFPKFSEADLYKMLHKKSSSIVKWILIISILEFAFWLLISFCMRGSNANKQLENLDIQYITTPMTIIGYLIILYFFYRFYINYRKITATDNVKKLMATILNTRRAVNQYIIVNIVWIIISCIVIFTIYFYKDERLNEALHQSEKNGTETTFYLIYIIGTVISLAAFIGIIWGFYKLIYGILLKRLHKNYNELKKIDF